LEWGGTKWKEDGSPLSGWVPVPCEYSRPISRLCGGKIDTTILSNIIPRFTWGLMKHQRDADWPNWTPWLTWDDLAEFAGTKVRAVQDAVHDMAKRRKLVKVQERRGLVRLQALWRDWPNLPDYTDVPRPALELVPPKEQQPAKLLEKPFTVRAGRKSRPIDIPGWEKQIAFRGGATDCAVSLFLESDSRLLVETAATVKSNLDADIEDAGSKQSAIGTTVPVGAGEKSSPAKSTSTEVGELLNITPILTELLKYGHTDDASAAKLVGACRANAAECTVAEIAGAIALKAQDMGSNVRQKIAWLLKVVPSCFVGESYRLMKQGIERPVEDFLSPKSRAMVERLKRQGYK